MNAGTLLSGLLTLHVLALIAMAGTTLVEFINYKTFWNLYAAYPDRADIVLQSMKKFARIIGIGAALLILTGIGMMAVTHGVFGEQLWFRIKFGFVIALILNSVIFGRRQQLKLRVAIKTENTNIEKIKAIKYNISLFHITQLLIFSVIVTLSVFKFI